MFSALTSVFYNHHTTHVHVATHNYILGTPLSRKSKSQPSAAGRVPIFLFHSTAPMIFPLPTIICRYCCHRRRDSLCDCWRPFPVSIEVVTQESDPACLEILLLPRDQTNLPLLHSYPRVTQTKEPMSVFGGNNHRFISGTLTPNGAQQRFMTYEPIQSTYSLCTARTVSGVVCLYLKVGTFKVIKTFQRIHPFLTTVGSYTTCVSC